MLHIDTNASEGGRELRGRREGRRKGEGGGREGEGEGR